MRSAIGRSGDALEVLPHNDLGLRRGLDGDLHAVRVLLAQSGALRRERRVAGVCDFAGWAGGSVLGSW